MEPTNVKSGYLFITGSVYRRIPIFRYSAPCRIFLRSLEAYRRSYGLRLHAYVLMPDHYHLLLWFPPERRLADFLRDFKSLAGKQIIDWLRREKLEQLLDRFRLARPPKQRRDARSSILQQKTHVKVLSTSRALGQKIEYIHMNPVVERLAESPHLYLHSSARAYAGTELTPAKVDLLELPYD
ncbi:MAG TPA: transposase [Candidatus Xenobia bacterium]|nr:transposase [Candidatus Xenobia bacterium]